MALGVQTLLRRLSWKDVLLIAAIVGTFGQSIVYGFAPGEHRHVDSQVFYVAGRSLLHGTSPYDSTTADARWQEALGKHYDVDLPFLNPPTFFPWLAATTWMPFNVWGHLVDGLHILGVGLLLWGLFGLADRLFPSSSRTLRLLGLALAGLATCLVYEVQWGEDSLFIVVALVWAWRLLIDGQSRLAMALLVGIASIKPQLSLMPALAVIVGYGRPRQWLSGLVIGAGYCLAIGIAFGFSLYREFPRALDLWPRSMFNRPEQVSGLMNLSAGIGVTISPMFLFATSVGVGAFLAGLYRIFRWPEESSDERKRSLVLLTLVIWLVNEALLPFHTYDHTILMVPLALSVLFPTWISGSLLPGLVIAARPNLVGRLVGQALSPEQIVTGALLISSVVSIVVLLRPWPLSERLVESTERP